MADLDELDLIMARLANQASSSSTSATATATANAVSASSQNMFKHRQQQQQQNKHNNEGPSSSDSDSDDDDVLAALGKAPQSSSSASDHQKQKQDRKNKKQQEELQKEQEQKHRQEAQQAQEQEQKEKQEKSKSYYASESVISRILQDEERIGSLISSHLSLRDELHLASRSHNALSDGDRNLRLEKWKTLCGGPLNPSNLAGSSGLTDLFSPTSLSRYAEVYLEAWTLDSDSFLLRRARSILVSEMLFLLELERDEGRRRIEMNMESGGVSNNNNKMKMSSSFLHHQQSSPSSSPAHQGIHGVSSFEPIREHQSKQQSFEDTYFSSSTLPPPRTLDFTPSSSAAQECLRLIHHDRFASPEKWLFLLKEIKNLPLSKVRHVWQYAIKTFPSTTWLVCQYLELEIQAEKQLFDQVIENMNNEVNNNNNQNNFTNQDDWLAVLTARLRILDTFESHLRVCVGSSQLHALFLRYASETVADLDQVTKLQLSYKCIQQAGRCFDAYVLWKEVLKNRRGLIDERSVIETRRIFHRLLETPMDELEQAKVEYIDFESKVSNVASASSTASLPNQLNQAYRTAVDEFNERKAHWDNIAQRQRWLGNLALRTAQERLRQQTQQRLQQRPGAGPGSSSLSSMRSIGANNGNNAALLHGKNADRTASIGAVTTSIGSEEGKIPASVVEETVANSLPCLLPLSPHAVFNSTTREGRNDEHQHHQEIDCYLRKKLLEVEKMKGYDVLFDMVVSSSHPQQHNPKLFLSSSHNGQQQNQQAPSLFEENEAMIEFLFPSSGREGNKDRESGSATSLSEALLLDDAAVFDAKHRNGSDDDEAIDIDDEEETNKRAGATFGRGASSTTSSTGGSSSSTADFFLNSSKSSAAQKLKRKNKKMLYQHVREELPKNFETKKRMEALTQGRRLLAFHSSWDALIELETRALKILLDGANNNNSSASASTAASSSSSGQTTLQLIQNATSSADGLRQIATRCRRISSLWEQRCRSEPFFPSHWLMWGKARFHFSAAKVKLSMAVLSEEEQRQELQEVFSIYAEAISRFPDNLVLVNSLCDLLTSYGDSTSANSLFFALTQQFVNQAKLLFLYEQESSLELKVNFSASSDENSREAQQQQLRQTQRARIQTLIQLLKNRNVQTFCEVVEQKQPTTSTTTTKESQPENTTDESTNDEKQDSQQPVEEDSAANILSSSSPQQQQQQRQNLITLNQYLVPLGWRFCDRPRFSDSVIASVLGNPYESATNSLLHSISMSEKNLSSIDAEELALELLKTKNNQNINNSIHQQTKLNNHFALQTRRKFVFSKLTSSYLSNIRNQIKDNIAISNISWMKWLLRSKNTRFWSRGVTGFAEVDNSVFMTMMKDDATENNNNNNNNNNRQQDASLIHMRAVARYAVSKCGIARHSLFLYSWAKLEANSGSQQSAAAAVESICRIWKRNIQQSIVGVALQIKSKLIQNQQQQKQQNEISASTLSTDQQLIQLFRGVSSAINGVLSDVAKKNHQHSSSSSSFSSILHHCGADGLFFETLRTLDLLKSATKKSSLATTEESSFLVENTFRQEIAETLHREVIQAVLVDFIASSSTTHQQTQTLLAKTIQNFAKNASDNSLLLPFSPSLFSSLLLGNENNINSQDACSSSPLTPLQIIKLLSPSLYSLADEVRSLFVQADSYRQIRLSSSSGASTASSLFNHISNFASASRNALALKSSINHGEVTVFEKSQLQQRESRELQEQEEEDFGALATTSVWTNNSVHHHQHDVRSPLEDFFHSQSLFTRPSFSHFTKVSDGESSGRHGIKLLTKRSYLEEQRQQQSLSAALKLKQKNREHNRKKNGDDGSNSSASPASSAAASPLQFILPHLANKQQQDTNNNNNNKNNRTNQRQTAAQLRQQHYAEQQMKIIQSTLSSRGATEFYSTVLLDIHRRSSAWGWESVVMRLLAGPPTRADRAKPPEVRAAEESLAIFKSTLPAYHKSRTANASLMNAVLSKQADRDADAIVADLELESERVMEEVLAADAKKKMLLQQKKQHQQQASSSAIDALETMTATPSQRIRTSSLMTNLIMENGEEDQDQDELLSLAVENKDADSEKKKMLRMKNKLLSSEDDDDDEDDDDYLTQQNGSKNNLLLESTAAWDQFAGKFSSNALFRLIHRLPSAHGIGYQPSMSMLSGNDVEGGRKTNNNNSTTDNNTDAAVEEIDFAKAAVHSHTMLKKKRRKMMKTDENDEDELLLAEENDDEDEENNDNSDKIHMKIPTTKFVFDSLLKTF